MDPVPDNVMLAVIDENGYLVSVLQKPTEKDYTRTDCVLPPPTTVDKMTDQWQWVNGEWVDHTPIVNPVGPNQLRWVKP